MPSLRNNKTVRSAAWAVAAAACWLAGAATSQAGCGDYLVGVGKSGGHPPAAPMTPGERVPECRSCNLPAAPATPVVNVERLPVDPIVEHADAAPALERGGWAHADPEPSLQILSQTPDRPPKA